MFNCKSYIRKPEKLIEDLDDAVSFPNKYFINISDLNENKYLKKSLDLDYLDGAIYLTYYSEVIIGFREWDLVDQLWAYVINLIEEFLGNKQSSTYLPDQFIKLEMKEITSKELLFVVESNNEFKKFLLPTNQFVNMLIKSAKHFFEQISNFYSNDMLYSFELDKIKKLENIFNNL